MKAAARALADISSMDIMFTKSMKNGQGGQLILILDNQIESLATTNC